MKIQDFIKVMDANKGIWPEWDSYTQSQKEYLARVNICTGTAESFYDGDRLYGVMGVRYIGIGEAWGVTLPDDRRPTLLRKARGVFNRMADDKNLWRVFAESKISEHFLEHLGFERNSGMHIWLRK